MAHMLFLGPELNRFALQMDYILRGIALAAGVPQTWTNLIMQLRAWIEFQAQVNRCGLYIALENHVAIGYVGR
jgi:hypothetical protein